jgi:hypothetical protein
MSLDNRATPRYYKKGGTHIMSEIDLKHTGVMGMRWGRRKASSSLAKSLHKPISKSLVLDKPISSKTAEGRRQIAKQTKLISRLNKINMSKKYNKVTKEEVRAAEKSIRYAVSKIGPRPFSLLFYPQGYVLSKIMGRVVAKEKKAYDQLSPKDKKKLLLDNGLMANTEHNRQQQLFNQQVNQQNFDNQMNGF